MSQARPRPPLRLITDAFPDRPGYDTAVSRALLLRVASGDEPETFRLHPAGPVLAFGRQDAGRIGYQQAARAARARGFEPVQRLAGGRAAVFHEATLAFSHATPDATPAARTLRRFAATADVMCTALRSVGVDANVGEVPGEYCAGAYSVNARGRRKLMGVGQRLVAGAAHVGGVVVVAGADRIRDVLTPVYEALTIPWDPSTAGSVEDEIGPVAVEAVAQAILDELSEHYDLVDGRLDPGTLALADQLVVEHLVPRDPADPPTAGGEATALQASSG